MSIACRIACRFPRPVRLDAERSEPSRRTARGILALFLFLLHSHFAGAVDVALTGVDLHTLGRVVFGELMAGSYELPDELADEKTVSVFWQGAAARDPVKMYRGLLEQRGYTVVESLGLYRVVRLMDSVVVYKAENRPLPEILNALSGYPGVRVRMSGGAPGAETDKGGDLIKPGALRDLDSVVVAGRQERVNAWLDAARKIDRMPDAVQVKAAVFEVSLSDGETNALELAGRLLDAGGHRGSFGADVSKGAFSLGIGGLSLTVTSLARDARFKLLSEPYLSVTSGESARLAVGTKLPILTETTTSDAGRQTQSVRYVDAGVVLEVVPVKRGDSWELTISQELSSVQAVGSGVAGNPIFSTRGVKTKLRAALGEVKVLAGLDSIEQNGARSGVPFFRMFGRVEESRTRSQILLLVELSEGVDAEEQRRKFVAQLSPK